MTEYSDVMYKLGSIESLLKTQAEQINTLVDNAKEQHENHETRIVKLESTQIAQHARLGLIAGVVGLFSGGTVEAVARWLKLH